MSVTTPLSVRVSTELHERINTLATASQRTPSDLARLALERALPALEWEQHVVEMARAYRNGDLRPVTAEELDHILGLTDVPVDLSVLDDIE